jgi:2-dehydropantoate 2-reductase
VRIAVFGAGAVGGLVAARLALAGLPVSVVARGAHLKAIRERGLRLRTRETDRIAKVAATDDAGALGRQDLVVIATKAHALPAAAADIARLVGPETVLVPAQNGIPWWYFHRAGPPFEGAAVRAVDPEGALIELLPPARVVGCVVYVGAAVPTPGVIDHSSGELFVFGEPDGTMTERLERVVTVFRQGGFEAETTARIRDAVWLKLWGNLSMNPVSVLAQATTDRLLADDGVRRLLRLLMDEAARVAGELGVSLGTTAEERLGLAERLGAFKTSMLQDLEAGRPLETAPLVGAVTELARKLDIATPMLDAVEALLRLRGAAAR